MILKAPSAAVIGGTIAGALAFLLAVVASIHFLRRRWHTRHLQARIITPLERNLLSDSMRGSRNMGSSEKGRSMLTNSAYAYTQPDTVHSMPAQDPSRSDQHMMLEPEDVQTQMVTIKASVAQMLEHVRRIEAHIEEVDLPPPTYISS